MVGGPSKIHGHVVITNSGHVSAQLPAGKARILTRTTSRFLYWFIGRALLAMACVVAAGATPSLAAGRLALVIGNGAYQAAPHLENPANDAADLAKALRAIGFDVIERRDATREDMAGAVRDFAERIGTADTALFFYAGHGLQMNGENYLLPVDAKIESQADVRFNTINLTDIQQEMEGGGRANIIILDACRNNPFVDKLAKTGRGGGERGLGRIEASGVGSLVVFSTQPNNVALDGAGRNSPFAAALIKYVGLPGLEVRQMISKVRGDVLAATSQKQVPWDNSSLTGDVYLAGPPPQADAATAATPVAASTPVVVAAAPTPQPSTAPRDAAPPPAPTPTGALAALSPEAAECDKLAAPLPRFAGPDAIKKSRLPVDWSRALVVCTAAQAQNPGDARFEYELGITQYNLKDYLEALHHLTIAADAGLAEAQNQLGFMFVTGTGTVKDTHRAFEYFQKAANAGLGGGMGNLGSMYANGFGVKEDDAMALALYEKAIEAGNPFALSQIAVMYYNGKGTPVDYNAAEQYFQQAADLNDGYAMKFLAVMYERGLLGPADPAQAAQLRLRAAQDDPTSQTPDVPLPKVIPRPQAHRAPARRIFYYRYRLNNCWPLC